METGQQSSTKFLLRLSDVTSSDLDRVGAKAANLASLRKAGFPIPDGIVLTADAYATFIAENRLGSDLTPDSVTSASIPADGRMALVEAADILGCTALAVRSSAVAEDLSDASFAGQYETVLNVNGSRGIERAVKRCWISGFSRHLTTYRDRHGLPDTPMAVLIQRMVDADAAGVAFSANPVSGARDEVAINAVRGLGNTLVSGQVTPDSWIVSGDSAHRTSGPADVIDAGQAVEIAEMARRAEAHFGSPQDIEWAIENGRLYLLQSRPITSLPEPAIEPIPINVEVPSGFWQYDASHHPRPGHHIDLFILPLIGATSRRWFREFGYLFEAIEFREIGLWPYHRLVPLGGKQGPMPPRWLMWLLVRTIPTLRRRVKRAAEAVRTDKPGRYVQRWYEVWQPELSAAISRLREVELAALSDRELDRYVESIRDLVERGIEVHSLLAGALAPVMYELVTTCEELLGWNMARTMDLVSGTSYKSTEPARRLHQLAVMASNRPAVRQLLEHGDERIVEQLGSVDDDFARAFDAYLHAYTFRALGYTIAEPSLAERPALVLEMIRGQIERGYDPEEEQVVSARKRAETAEEARARLAAGLPEARERFERVVARAERAYPVREDNEFYTISAPLALMRSAVLEIGRRLVERRIISDANDVMFLEMEVARSSLFADSDHKKLIKRRKGERAWAELNPGPPFYGEPPPPPPSLDFLPVDARLPMESMLWSFEAMMAMEESGKREATSDAMLRGIAASAGRYTGPVRVIMDETQFDKLRPGDVLVCPITSPVWSVLFPTIGALVTDTGGILSHPAIIAREYQLPAVVATGNATSRLEDGQIVTVDGLVGTVKISP